MTNTDHRQDTVPVQPQRVSLAAADVTLLRDTLLKGHSWTALTILSDALKQQAPDLVPLGEIDIVGSARDGIMRRVPNLLIVDRLDPKRRAVDVYRAPVSDGVFMDVTVPPGAIDALNDVTGSSMSYVTQVWVTDNPAKEVEQQKQAAVPRINVSPGEGHHASAIVGDERIVSFAWPEPREPDSTPQTTVSLSVSVEQPADVLGVGQDHPANAGYESVTRERLATNLMLQAMDEGVITLTREPTGDGVVRHVATAHFGSSPPPPSTHVAGITFPLPSHQEQAAFEEWATESRYEMHQHPLHYLFVDKQTNAARQGWKAALAFVRKLSEGSTDGP